MLSINPNMKQLVLRQLEERGTKDTGTTCSAGDDGKIQSAA